MPARPTTTRSVPAARTSGVTCVALRITSAATPSTACSSSSGVSPRRTSTSSPAARMDSSPDSASSSLTRTRLLTAPPPMGRTLCRARPRSLREEVGDAAAALTEVVVTERERQPRVAGRAERLAGDDRDLGLVEQHLGQVGRGRDLAAAVLAVEQRVEAREAVERALRLEALDPRDRREDRVHRLASTRERVAHLRHRLEVAADGCPRRVLRGVRDV